MTRRSAVSTTAAACLFLTGALLSMLYFGALMLGAAGDIEQERADAYDQGFSDAEREHAQLVSDRPLPEGNHMPLWLQTDPQWSYIPYAGGTIGDSGCGLVAAAMAIKYMTLQEVTPLQLADAVGDTCLTDGVNDPKKFCEYIQRVYPEYGIETTYQMWNMSDVAQFVDDGWMAFGDMSGEIGDSDYSGHVVLIWRSDDDGYWVRDPASAGNSSRPFTLEELEQVHFKYFYCIRGGLYGA